MQESYITFGEIQQHIWQTLQSKKRRIGFRQAALELYECGQCRAQCPSPPDFLTWDLQDMAQLQQLAWAMPVCVQPQLLPAPPQRSAFGTAEETALTQELLQPASSVRISLESVASPPVFTALPVHFVVLYVLKGTGVLHTPHLIQTLPAGQLVVLAPGVPYYMECTLTDLVVDIIVEKQRFEAGFLDVTPYPTPLHDFFRKALYASSREYLRFTLLPKEPLMLPLQHLFAESAARQPYVETAFVHWLQLFFVQLLRTPQPLPKTEDGRSSSDRRALVTTLLQYIQQHYTDLTLTELAAAFHYAPDYLCRLIRRETGRTLSQLLADCRLQAAKRALEDPRLSIGEIAEQVGYHSADHFAAMFRQQTGMPPSVWRSKLRQGGTQQ